MGKQVDLIGHWLTSTWG